MPGVISLTSGTGRGLSPCSVQNGAFRVFGHGRAAAIREAHTSGSPRCGLIVAAHKQIATHQMLLLALRTPALFDAVDTVVAHGRLRGRKRGALFLK